MKHPWLVSYDCTPEILQCYGGRRAFAYGLQYNASTAYVGTEVFFLSDRLKIPERSSVKSIDAALGGRNEPGLASTLYRKLAQERSLVLRLA